MQEDGFPFPLLDELCMATCTYCPDPCCFSAYAWFDFRDLLFAHLNGLAVPPAQLMTDRKMICRYLGVRGCTLERISRPWICTWYLCPAQLGALRADAACGKKAVFLETAKKSGGNGKRWKRRLLMPWKFDAIVMADRYKKHLNLSAQIDYHAPVRGSPDNYPRKKPQTEGKMDVIINNPIS